MGLFKDYLAEIENRRKQDLHPKPIEDGALVEELISQVNNPKNEHYHKSLNFLIYNTLPGTTSAAVKKALFLKKIILKDIVIDEITPDFAFELLSHMKGGPSIGVLLDLALAENTEIALKAAKVLKTLVFLYDADTDRLKVAYKEGSTIAKDILKSYADAEFFTSLPEIEDKIEIVTFVAAEGDISTDLMSPGAEAHSRADRELHGKCFISARAQKEIEALKAQHPGKRLMMIAEKGTMGVGSSRMSGINNVALWMGEKASPYVPFVNIAPIVAGTNGISPIFQTTVGVTGGIGVDLKNWVKKVGKDGKVIVNNDGNPILEEKYSVATGRTLTIDTKAKKLMNEDGSEELADLSAAFSPQSVEFMKAGGSYAIAFGKKLQIFAAETLGVEPKQVFAEPKVISHSDRGLTAAEKIFNANAVGVPKGNILYAGSDAMVRVNIVGSQDTTGPMTVQELEAMAATVIAPTLDGAYQSGCHTASVWDKKAQANNMHNCVFHVMDMFLNIC